MTNAPRTALEKFTALFRTLGLALAGRGMWGPLSSALLILINARLYRIRRRVQQTIGRLQAGTYTPRRTSPARRQPTPGKAQKPRQPSPLPDRKFGWLERLLPEAIQHRAWLHALLQDPEVVQLIAAAPTALGRPLRSLCWMLKVKPPPILTNPPPASAPDQPPPPGPKATREPPAANTLGLHLLQFGLVGPPAKTA